MITIEQKISINRGSRGRRRLSAGLRSVTPRSEPRLPRISRLMALAIRFDKLIRTGKIHDQSQLAVLAHVTQARMTQIMNLNLLAPDIQEELLHLPPAEAGRLSIHEKALRPIIGEPDWNRQRIMWASLRNTTSA
jgi:hypothetical protein